MGYSPTQWSVGFIVSAHENPCGLNVEKTFDKQKDVYCVFSGFEKDTV